MDTLDSFGEVEKFTDTEVDSLLSTRDLINRDLHDLREDRDLIVIFTHFQRLLH